MNHTTDRIIHDLKESLTQINTAPEIKLFKVDDDRSAKLLIPAAQLLLIGADEKDPWIFCTINSDGSLMISKAPKKEGYEAKACEIESILPFFTINLYKRNDSNVSILPVGHTSYPVLFKNKRIVTDGKLRLTSAFTFEQMDLLKQAARKNKVDEALFIKQAVIDAIHQSHTNPTLSSTEDAKPIKHLVEVRSWTYEEISQKWTDLFSSVKKGLKLCYLVSVSVPYENQPFNGNRLIMSIKPSASEVLEDQSGQENLTQFIRQHFGSHVIVEYHLKGTFNTQELSTEGSNMDAIAVSDTNNQDFNNHANSTENDTNVKSEQKNTTEQVTPFLDSNNPVQGIITLSDANTRLWSVYGEASIWDAAGFKIKDRISAKKEVNQLIIFDVPNGKEKNSRALHVSSPERHAVKFTKGSRWDVEFDGISGKRKYLATVSAQGIVIDLNQDACVVDAFIEKERLSKQTAKTDEKVGLFIDKLTSDGTDSSFLEVKTDAKFSSSTDASNQAVKEEKFIDLAEVIKAGKEIKPLSATYEAPYVEVLKTTATVGIKKSPALEKRLSDMDPIGLQSRLSKLKTIYEVMCYPHDVDVAIDALCATNTKVSKEDILYINIKNILESQQ